ncbi:hypothetical protein BRADI_5g14680v3 [Brachypodium distachyon]|uniref:Folate-biopterin transporter 2 n=1 Tax=Brachypodium distachyon TaxID=15368 RepID=A0A2K2CH85_BRADI|nr:hypothetical protein BRADI_5g14680v3 [Brachypodium distachyon]
MLVQYCRRNKFRVEVKLEDRVPIEHFAPCPETGYSAHRQISSASPCNQSPLVRPHSSCANSGGFSLDPREDPRRNCPSRAAIMDPRGREDGPLQEAAGAGADDDGGECGVASPCRWLRRLSRELHWSFVLAVFAVYGACQGVGNAVGGVAAGYYWKDVQGVQPSAAQFYQGVTDAPWVVKPLWGLLTDVVPIAGYRRRPYFLVAGVIGVSSMLMLSLQRNLGIMPAIVALTAQSAGAAIADVTVDALVAQNSITNPPLASDMQSLCGFSSSFGALIGFSISGLLVHSLGSQGALGLLSIPSVLVFSAGILLKESRVTDFDYKQVHRKFYKATQSMGVTLKCPEVWRPCVYIYVSLNLSLDIQGGMFYWYTDRLMGPAFSEGLIGLIYAIASVGSLLGVLLYQSALKDCNFRSMLLWGQVLSSLAGMLDLVLVTRLNMKIGIPDYIFAVIDNGVSQMVGQLKWLPLLVLCSKLCPPEMLEEGATTEAVKDGSVNVEFSDLVAENSSYYPSNVAAEDEIIKVIDAVGDDVELIPLMNKTTAV